MCSHQCQVLAAKLKLQGNGHRSPTCTLQCRQTSSILCNHKVSCLPLSAMQAMQAIPAWLANLYTLSLRCVYSQALCKATSYKECALNSDVDTLISLSTGNGTRGWSSSQGTTTPLQAVGPPADHSPWCKLPAPCMANACCLLNTSCVAVRGQPSLLFRSGSLKFKSVRCPPVPLTAHNFVVCSAYLSSCSA